MNEVMNTLPLIEFPSVLGVIAIKVSLLILGAALIASTLRKAPAAARHGVWMLALVGALLLSPLAVLLPEWRVPVSNVLPTSSSVPDQGVSPVTEAPEWPKSHSPEADVASAAPALPSLASASNKAVPRSFLAWLTIGWLIGAFTVSLYFIGGILRAWVWAKRADPVTDESFLALARDLKWMVGIERDVALRWHRSASTPMTWGLTRPVILLPAGADEWSSERRRVVLIHELAHIRRLDCLSQFVVQLTCALHWFNPAVWWGASKMRSERERACDDAVLQFGTRPSSYASHLLDIARSVRSSMTVPVGAVAMARQSELEGRLVAILEPTRKRGGLDGARSVLAAGVLVAVLIPLAAFTPVTVPSGLISADESLSWAEVAAENARSSQAEVLGSAPSAAPAEGLSEDSSGGDKDVVVRQFSVRPGGTLVIDSDVGSINVLTGSGREVRVEVEREARGSRGATPEDLRLSFDHSGNTVRVTARKSDRRVQNLNARFNITVPQRFHVDLKTAGGSIQVDDLDGTVLAHTAGGSLRFGNISGGVKAHTSGGSIRLEGSSGDASLRTSGGSITIGRVDGDVSAQTSGGSVTVSDVRGDLVAVTSGGSIRARMSEPPRHASRLQTSGGSITLELHPQAAVSIDAQTSSGRVSTNFDVPPRPRDQQSTLRTDLNGGGAPLTLRTSAGSIRINRIGSTGAARPARPPAPSAALASAAARHQVSFEAGEVDVSEFEARMEALGERIGIWAEAFAERAVAPVVEWVESPEFERWVEEMAISATEISLTAVEEAMMALDEVQLEESIFEHLHEVPASTRHTMLKRLARDHPDAEVRARARCLLEAEC